MIGQNVFYLVGRDGALLPCLILVVDGVSGLQVQFVEPFQVYAGPHHLLYGVVVDCPHVSFRQFVGHVFVGKPLVGHRLRVIFVESSLFGAYPQVAFVVLRHAFDDGRAEPFFFFRRSLIFAVYLLLRVEVVDAS